VSVCVCVCMYVCVYVLYSRVCVCVCARVQGKIDKDDLRVGTQRVSADDIMMVRE
jgi:hypothetical protein